MDERDRRTMERAVESARIAIEHVSSGGPEWRSDLKTVDAAAKRVEEVSEQLKRVSLQLQAALAGIPSVDNFFGQNDPNETLRRQFSNELHVEPGHPPVFIWTTADDALVPFTHSKLFAEACERAGVPVEFTLFSHGPHGMGLALDAPNEARGWTTQLLAWLHQQWGA